MPVIDRLSDSLAIYGLQFYSCLDLGVRTSELSLLVVSYRCGAAVLTSNLVVVWAAKQPSLTAAIHPSKQICKSHIACRLGQW